MLSCLSIPSLPPAHFLTVCRKEIWGKLDLLSKRKDSYFSISFSTQLESRCQSISFPQLALASSHSFF